METLCICQVVSLPLGDRTFFHDEAMHRSLFDHSIIYEDAGMEDRKDTKSERLPYYSIH